MPHNIVHIGVGPRGRHWLQSVEQHPGFISHELWDPDPKALQQAAEILTKPNNPRLEQSMFARGRAQGGDAALIATDSPSHAELIEAALTAGLHVLVEKPFAMDLGRAQSLATLACARGLALMVAENYRFYRAERTLHALIRSGRLGQVHSAVCRDRRAQPASNQAPWVSQLEHPFIWEIAVHHFDSFRYLFSREIVAVQANQRQMPGSDYREGSGVDAWLDLDEGLRINYYGHFHAGRYEYRLRVEGSEGEAWTDRRFVYWRPRGKRWFRPVRPVPMTGNNGGGYPLGGHQSLLDQFQTGIEGESTFECSAADNLGTIAALDAAIRSISSGHREPVERPQP